MIRAQEDQHSLASQAGETQAPPDIGRRQLQLLPLAPKGHMAPLRRSLTHQAGGPPASRYAVTSSRICALRPDMSAPRRSASALRSIFSVVDCEERKHTPQVSPALPGPAG